MRAGTSGAPAGADCVAGGRVRAEEGEAGPAGKHPGYCLRELPWLIGAGGAAGVQKKGVGSRMTSAEPGGRWKAQRSP